MKLFRGRVAAVRQTVAALTTQRTFSTSFVALRGEWESNGRDKYRKNRDQFQKNNRYSNDDDFRPSERRYDNNRFDNRSNNRSNNRGNYRNNNSGGGRRGDKYPARDKRDPRDDALISRNRSHRQKDDGLRGLPDYELDKEALKTLKYEDFVPAEELEARDGLSPVPTQVLADKRVLSLPLVNSLIHNRGYDRLTPVQAKTLVPILNNESVVVRAKTGTGKTAAFAIPTIQKVIEAHKNGTSQNKVKAVIISPTRELAQQIADEISKILNYGGLSDISVQCFVGGLSKQQQLRQANLLPGARGPPCDILVATPGRLMDILEDPEVLAHFDELTFKVFDEADRLLDIGFERLLAQIRDTLASVTPKEHEVPLLMFSATADRNVMNFARNEFGSRVRTVDTIPKNEPTANELVDQTAVVCPTWAEVYEGVAERIASDYAAAKEEGKNFKAIVFMPTVAMVDNYERILKKCFPRDSPLRNLTMAIHGQKTQSSRQVRSDKFRKMDDAILITTDVVARGMDFPHVSHVFQVGVPGDVPSYIHRIGRTARIGNRGKSLLYFTNHVRPYLDSLARENVKPKMTPFQQNEEFHKEFLEIVPSSVMDDSEADDIINSMMSYMTMLKGKYNVDSHSFSRDMQPFVELFGLEKMNLNSSNRATWERRQRPRKNSGFGSSRRSRMRW